MEDLHTERLIAEPLHPDHLSELIIMHSDPVVMATLGGVRSEESIHEYFDINFQHWKDHGFGLWIFRDGNGAFIGRGGLRHLDVDDKDEIEIAYALAHPFWGKGFATEIARFSQQIGFEKLQLPELIALTTLDNAPSKRVMEKIGMTYHKDVIHKDHLCTLYRQDMDTYLMQRKTSIQLQDSIL